MKVIHDFNGLNGATVSRKQVENLIVEAKANEQFYLAMRLENALISYNDQTFIFDIDDPAFEEVPESLLQNLEYQVNKDEVHGLAKAVSPTEVYDMITAKVIAMIEAVNSSDYRKSWKGKQYGVGYTIPFNFVSKKRYRGVNALMLTDLIKPLENPFYLTFKQVTDLKGKVKKGAKAHHVVYFTKVFKVEDKANDKKFSTYDIDKAKGFASENNIDENNIGYIPILKYYNVYNGSDIEGIDFKLDQFKTGFINQPLPADEENRMPIPEAIIKNYPAPQPILKHGGDRAFHSGGGVGLIQMPYLSDFDTVQDYYRTLFHEYSHSTGSPQRLNRKLGNKFGSKPYAFEELIAEFGAIFLCAEAGIIWHNNKNHAAYLKSWASKLKYIKDDNKFIMKASTEAQKIADFILQFDDNGNPLYFKDLQKENQTKLRLKEKFKKAGAKAKKPVITPKTKLTKQELEAKNPKPYAIKPKSVAVTTAIKDIMSLSKFKNAPAPLITTLLFNLFKNIEENAVEIYSDYEIGILKKDSIFHSAYQGSTGWLYEIEITDEARNFINAVKGRLESLRNQKHNFALFDGLKGLKNENNPAWFPQYFQFKGKPKEAIKHLLKVKKGDCVAALYRKDIGNIDIVWGENDNKNKGFGLKHIVEKHGKEIAQFGLKVEDFLPMIIEHGKFKQLKELDKIELSGEMFKIIISKVAYDNGKKKEKTFVLSAFDLRPMWKKEKSRGLNGTYDGVSFAKKPLLSSTLDLDKDTKKGLKNPSTQNNFVEPKPVTTHLNKNSLAYKLQNKATAIHEYYNIPDKDLADFLGKIEKKNKESVAITITGGQGSMKTRLCFRLMNCFAQNYKVGHASIEEHPESALYEEKVHQYLNQKALHNIESPEINTIDDVHELVKSNDVIIIDSFSKLQEMQRGCELDKDFRKKYDGKLFIIIYQQTTDGKMRGGAKSQFDGDIICDVVKMPDYKENYVQANKNRYQNKNLDELKYNIFNGKLVDQQEPVTETKHKFSFEVVEN